eukprot:TRINITY_DN3259_c0_g1_i6.p1 TRINITY_DN3259_c0_g1~~TRINITY_DN3259_c0_g1_i6.p1  ORF type:complete len:195 (-),score=20.17 TRINITY_DN3259_c0_g1_i6:48-632(-)
MHVLGLCALFIIACSNVLETYERCSECSSACSGCSVGIDCSGGIKTVMVPKGWKNSTLFLPCPTNEFCTDRDQNKCRKTVGCSPRVNCEGNSICVSNSIPIISCNNASQFVPSSNISLNCTRVVFPNCTSVREWFEETKCKMIHILPMWAWVIIIVAGAFILIAFVVGICLYGWRRSRKRAQASVDKEWLMNNY